MEKGQGRVGEGQGRDRGVEKGQGRVGEGQGRGKEGNEVWGWGVKKGLEVGEWLGGSGSGKREKIWAVRCTFGFLCCTSESRVLFMCDLQTGLMSSLTLHLLLPLVSWSLSQCTDNGHTAVTGHRGHPTAGPPSGWRVLCAKHPNLDHLGTVHLTHNLRLPFCYSTHLQLRHTIPVRHP